MPPGIPVRPNIARKPLKQMAEYTINATVRAAGQPGLAVH
jgi:hypothetical protein